MMLSFVHSDGIDWLSEFKLDFPRKDEYGDETAHGKSSL
jgi:hypothetical protein